MSVPACCIAVLGWYARLLPASSTVPGADATPNAKRQTPSADARHANGWASPWKVSDFALARPREPGRQDVTAVQPGGGPTVRRMLVGARLRRLRTEQGISREQAGEAIRASEGKIHRLA